MALSESPTNTASHVLRNVCVFQFDHTMVVKSEPLILEGGYENFLLYYPTLTTNAQVSKPSYYQILDSQAPSREFDVSLVVYCFLLTCAFQAFLLLTTKTRSSAKIMNV